MAVPGYAEARDRGIRVRGDEHSRPTGREVAHLDLAALHVADVPPVGEEATLLGVRRDDLALPARHLAEETPDPETAPLLDTSSCRPSGDQSQAHFPSISSAGAGAVPGAGGARGTITTWLVEGLPSAIREPSGDGTGAAQLASGSPGTRVMSLPSGLIVQTPYAPLRFE